MRYDTPIYFQRIARGAYNADTGNYEIDTVHETLRYAAVTTSGSEIVSLIYGELKQGSLTVRLQRHYNDTFDRIRIGGKVYRADMSRKLRNGHTFVLSEVQNGKGNYD